MEHSQHFASTTIHVGRTLAPTRPLLDFYYYSSRVLDLVPVSFDEWIFDSAIEHGPWTPGPSPHQPKLDLIGQDGLDWVPPWSSLYLPEAPSMDAGLLDCWAAGIGDLVQISFVGPRSLHVLMRSRAVVQRLVFIVSCSSSSSLSSSYNLCGSLSRLAFSGLREEFVHVVPIPLPLTCFHHSRPGIGSALSQREHYSGRPLLIQPPLRLHLGQASCLHVPR